MSIELAVQDGIATVTLSRPERFNAFTIGMYEDFTRALAEMDKRSDIRVMVITGKGKAFSAGGDVNEIIGHLVNAGASERLAFTHGASVIAQRMRECRFPIIAAVNGVAAGAGAAIALASDLRVFAEKASLAFVFVRAALGGGDMGSAYLLPRMIGFGRAMDLLLRGKSISAQEALEWGLASSVVPEADLPAAAEALARELRDGPFMAQLATKTQLWAQLDSKLENSVLMDSLVQTILQSTTDHKEFHAAFTTKRKPQWKGE